MKSQDHKTTELQTMDLCVAEGERVLWSVVS